MFMVAVTMMTLCSRIWLLLQTDLRFINSRDMFHDLWYNVLNIIAPRFLFMGGMKSKIDLFDNSRICHLLLVSPPCLLNNRDKEFLMRSLQFNDLLLVFLLNYRNSIFVFLDDVFRSFVK